MPAFALPLKEALLDGCLGRRVNRRTLAKQQRRRLAGPLYCLFGIGRETTFAPGCEPFAAIDDSERSFTASDFTRAPVVELVPDGVADVRITYSGEAPLVVPAKENSFAFAPPPAPRGLDARLKRLLAEFGQRRSTAAVARWDQALSRSDPAKIEWLSANGDLLRRIAAPSAASQAAAAIGQIRAPIGG